MNRKIILFFKHALSYYLIMNKGRVEQVEIKGQVERITYTNEENGYVIAKIKLPGRQDLITVVGNLFTITPGEVLRLTGDRKSVV